MSKNRGVVYIKPGLVEVHDIADPKFEDTRGRKINHAVIFCSRSARYRRESGLNRVTGIS
jgi:hypothetical protein